MNQRDEPVALPLNSDIVLSFAGNPHSPASNSDEKTNRCFTVWIRKRGVLRASFHDNHERLPCQNLRCARRATKPAYFRQASSRKRLVSQISADYVDPKSIKEIGVTSSCNVSKLWIMSRVFGRKKDKRARRLSGSSGGCVRPIALTTYCPGRSAKAPVADAFAPVLL